jgi:hypothetical protein
MPYRDRPAERLGEPERSRCDTPDTRWAEPTAGGPGQPQPSNDAGPEPGHFVGCVSHDQNGPCIVDALNP